MKLLLNKTIYLLIGTLLSITLLYQPILALDNFYPESLNGSSNAPLGTSYFNKSTFEYIVTPIEEIDDTVITYNGSKSFRVGDYFDSEYLHKWNPNITENTEFVNINDETDNQYTLNDLKNVLSKMKLGFDNYDYIYSRKGYDLTDSTKYPFDPDLPSNTSVYRILPSDRVVSLHHYITYYSDSISSGDDLLSDLYCVTLPDISYSNIYETDEIKTFGDNQYTLRAFNNGASGLVSSQKIVFIYDAIADKCAFEPHWLIDHVYPFLTYSPGLDPNYTAADLVSYNHNGSIPVFPKKAAIKENWTYQLGPIYTSKKYFLSQNLLQVFEVSHSTTSRIAHFGTSRIIGVYDDNQTTFQYNTLDDYPMFNYGPFNFDPLYQSSYTISLSSNNTEYGTVEGGGSFESGTTITIKAIPSSNAYRFVEWSDHNTDQERELFVNADYSLTAIFAPKTEYTITLNSEPEISGHFNGDGNHFDGDTVEIEAIPYKGYSFSHWSDGNEDQKRNLLISDNIELTAYFTEGGLSGKIDAGPIITIIMICAFLLMLKGF